jgi:hypothetical protein
VADATRYLCRVALDLHPPTTPVAELTPGHVFVQVLRPQLHARGEALDDACETGAVRLAGGDETERHGS